MENGTRARLSQLGFYLRILVTVVVVLQLVLLLGILNRIEESGMFARFALLGDLQSGESRIRVLTVLQVATFLFLAVVFIMWVHRAYSNLARLEVKLSSESSWAVLAFLLPGFFFYRPYQIVMEIIRQNWRILNFFKTEDEGLRELNLPSEQSLRNLTSWWWVTRWITILLGFIAYSGFGELRDLDDVRAAWILAIMAALLSIVPMVLGLIMTRRLNRVEEATYQLWQSGIIDDYKERKAAGQANASASAEGTPGWYRNPQENELNYPKDDTFVDQ